MLLLLEDNSFKRDSRAMLSWVKIVNKDGRGLEYNSSRKDNRGKLSSGAGRRQLTTDGQGLLVLEENSCRKYNRKRLSSALGGGNQQKIHGVANSGRKLI